MTNGRNAKTARRAANEAAEKVNSDAAAAIAVAVEYTRQVDERLYSFLNLGFFGRISWLLRGR